MPNLIFWLQCRSRGAQPVHLDMRKCSAACSRTERHLHLPRQVRQDVRRLGVHQRRHLLFRIGALRRCHGCSMGSRRAAGRRGWVRVPPRCHDEGADETSAASERWRRHYPHADQRTSFCRCCLQSQLPLCRTVQCPGFTCCVRLRGDPRMTAHTGRLSSLLRVCLSVLGTPNPAFGVASNGSCKGPRQLRPATLCFLVCARALQRSVNAQNSCACIQRRC